MMSFEELDRAHVAFRRLFFGIYRYCGLGILAVIAVAILNRKLFPPYGLSMAGTGITKIVAGALVIAWIIYMKIGMNKVKHMMNERTLTLFTAPMVLAIKAREAGYKMSGFFGELKPLERK